MNENKTSCAPADNQQTLWDSIDWTKAELSVRKLQARIVKAQKDGKHNKVKSLQWTLTHSFYAKALAVKRVTSNGGGNTPGVDMETWEKPETKMQAINDLRRRGYQPKPLRRVHIKKGNGKLRPLGIPTMKDRAMQALYLMALEPVSETTADTRSYGFRKERRCMDAVMQCHNILRKGYSPEWILEGDIKGCFDHISHKWLLANIPMDKAMLRKWLKCGYIFNKQMFPTEEGTPQGGIISPTLANMTLDGLQKVLAERYKRVRINGKLYSPMVNLVRYADDFIITCENRETLENEIKPLIAEFMAERGLTLSEEKTVITNIRDGFDFLGFNIRKYGNKILTKPTKKAEKRFMENIRKVIKGNKGCKQESLIRMLNSKIRGWGAYYQHGATRDSFHRIDHQIFLSLWQWAKRRHSKKGKRWIKDRYWHNIRGNCWTFAAKFKKSNGRDDQLTLLTLSSSFPFLPYTQIKGDMNPFDVDCRLYFNQRMKSKMLVSLKGRKSLLYLWEKQGRICPICGDPINTYKPDEWNVYGEIKRKLTDDYGIPASEIRFIQECKTEAAKKAMIAGMNAGSIRVLFGSTEMLGTGVNAQQRAVAVHHLDTPWVPSALEQRDGRAIRKGNEVARFHAENKVDVIIYAVEKSLDSYKFNLLHNKQLFINQLKTNSLGSRSIDEGGMDEATGMNFSEYVAVLSGNTDLLEKARLDKKVMAMESERKNFLYERDTARSQLAKLRGAVEFHEKKIAEAGKDRTVFEERVKKNEDGTYQNPIRIDGVEDGRDIKTIARRLKEYEEKARTGGEHMPIGELYGFQLSVKSEASMKESFDFVDNRFFVKGCGSIYYTYNNGHLAEDPKLACMNFLNALEKIPRVVESHRKELAATQAKIPTFETMVSAVWKKEEELQELKRQAAELDRKIALSLKKEDNSEVKSDKTVAPYATIAADVPLREELKRERPSKRNHTDWKEIREDEKIKPCIKSGRW